MDKKYCSECGKENKLEAAFCESCGTAFKEISENSNNISNENLNGTSTNHEDNVTVIKKCNEIGTLSLIFYFGGPLILVSGSFARNEILSRIFSVFGLLVCLGGIVLMIYGRIKYPKNKFIRDVMLIIIVLTILNIIYFVIVSIMLYSICKTCTNIY